MIRVALVGWMMMMGGAAHAQSGARLGILRMPITPFDEHRQEFHALIKHKLADGRVWVSDTEGFECLGNGEYVEVWVRGSSWPAKVPKRVVCSSDVGKVKAKIEIADNKLQPMFLPNGYLIMPREKGESAIYNGPSPRQDVGVQVGQSGSLSILCQVEAGQQLNVVAYPDMKDGEGRCTLKSRHGEVIQIPVIVRTVKRER